MQVLTLGEKIKNRRKELDLTLKEVAMDKVTPGQISLVETGKSNPSIDLLNYLSERLDISIDYLMETEYTQVDRIVTHYSDLFKAAIVLKDLERARRYLEIVEKTVKEYNFNNQKIKLLYLKGLYSFNIKEYDEALSLLTQASLNDNIFNYKEVYNLYANIGEILFIEGSYKAALTYFLGLETIAQEKFIDNQKMSYIYFLIAKTLNELKEYDRMSDYIKKSFSAIYKNMSKEYLLRKYLDQYKEFVDKGEEEKADLVVTQIKNATIEKRYEDISEEIMLKMAKLSKQIGYTQGQVEAAFYNYTRKLMKTSSDIPTAFCDFIEAHIDCGNIRMSSKLLALLEDPYFVKDNLSKLRIHEIKAVIEELSANEAGTENNLIIAYNIANNKKLEEKEHELALKMASFYMKIDDENQASKYLDQFMKENDCSAFSKEK